MTTTKQKIKIILKKTDMPRKTILLTKDEDIIETLLHGITASVNNIMLTSFDSYDDIKELLKFLEQTIGNTDIKNKKQLSKVIAKEKTRLIYIIRSLEGSYTKTEKKIKFLKDVINKIEILEVSLLYSNEKNTAKINHDIVNNIIFEEKNIYQSKHLITHYPYMINLYNDGENILEKVIEKYLELTEKYAREKCDKTELYYYDDILETLLVEDKIRITNEEKEKVIDRIKDSLQEKEYIGKEKERLFLWLNHLITVLNDKDYNIDIETLNHMYGIRNYFKKGIIDEANLYLLTNKPKRIDEKTETIITIDGIETDNRDDALSVIRNEKGNYVLKIYIADPNSYFNNNSLIINEAKKRTQSLYHELSHVEMFPDEIVKNYLSLDENKPRYMRIFRYEIDKYGNIVDFKIEKQVRETNYNLTYDQVNSIIDSGEENLEHFKTICLLEELKSILKNKMIKKIIISESEPNTKLSNGNAEELVALYMIFNNHQVAKFFKNNNLPFIYRHHENNSKLTHNFNYENISPKDKSGFESIIEQLESLNQSAKYSNTLSNHEALGLDEYSHTTSPNRRYADICAASCIDKFVFNKPTDKEAYEFEAQLKQDIDYINNRNNEIFEYYKKLIRVKKE